MVQFKFKSFSKENFKIIVKENEKHLWNKYFAEHHYMDHKLPQACSFYTFYFIKDNKEILFGCSGLLFQISKKYIAKRLTRVVVLPEYQGLGYGSKIINIMGSYCANNNIQKLYITTFHPRLGEYLKASSNWKASHNNLLEFKTNEQANSNGMSGLRDGVSMYRYYYDGLGNNTKLKMFYSPLKILSLQNEIKALQKEDNEKNKKRIKELIQELNIQLNIKDNSKYIDIIPEKLTINSEQHKKAKEEHKTLFKKNKRIPLTASERKAKKLELKLQKEKENENNSLDEF
jgi:N-acetylglutamate synthase-like GNAT family acetyltransferase